MGKASRDKGKRGERAARDAVKPWFPEVRRAVQSDGAKSGDLAETDPFHFEVKRYRRIVALDFIRESAKQGEMVVTEEERIVAVDFQRQAVADAQAQKNPRLPLVLMREDGDSEWVQMLRLSDLERLIREWPHSESE